MFIHMQIDILDILFINFPFAQFEKSSTELPISPRLRPRFTGGIRGYMVAHLSTQTRKNPLATRPEGEVGYQGGHLP